MPDPVLPFTSLYKWMYSRNLLLTSGGSLQQWLVQDSRVSQKYVRPPIQMSFLLWKATKVS